MKTTLVIHPKDTTTDFLSSIYQGRDWDVISEEVSHQKLHYEITNHDRIVMLGHGTEYGLIGWSCFAINSSFIEVLKDKDCVYIWCNADKFVNQHELQGFYTGMIISEQPEAALFQIKATDNEIAHSNTMFALAVKKAIFSHNMADKVKLNYTTEINPIIRFNHRNIFNT